MATMAPTMVALIVMVSVSRALDVCQFVAEHTGELFLRQNFQ